MKSYKNILLLVLLVGLGWLTFNLINKEKSSLSDSALSDFAIKDTASITRIKITSNMGGEVEFKKTNNVWQTIDGGCIQQHMLDNFLETIKYIAVKSPVPKGTVQNVNKRILGQHKRIEIYQGDKLAKTWFVGGSTADHYGTYMLLKLEDIGISPEPFIMYMPSVYGNLSDQFSLRIKDYQCSGIFNYNPLDIQSVEVSIPEDSTLNFEIFALDSNTFELYNNGNKISQFDTTKIRSYLLGYQMIHYDVKEPIIPTYLRDSTLNNTPNYVIKVTNKEKEINIVKTYIKYPEHNNYDYDGNLIMNDLNNLFAVTNSNDFVLIQYFVFDKLFRDVNYFKIK